MALSHFLQPKSRLSICRLGFLAAQTRISSSLCSLFECHDPPPPSDKEEAVAEETRVAPAEPLVEECLLLLKSTTLEKSTGLSSNAALIKNATRGGSNKPKTLIDLFMEQNGRKTSAIAENEVAKPKEELCGVADNEFAKPKEELWEVADNEVANPKEELWEVVLDTDLNTGSAPLSNSNNLFSSESSSGSEKECSEDSPSGTDENHLPKFQDVTPSDSVQEMQNECSEGSSSDMDENHLPKLLDVTPSDSVREMQNECSEGSPSDTGENHPPKLLDVTPSDSVQEMQNECSQGSPSDTDENYLPKFQDETPSDSVQERLDLKVKSPYDERAEEQIAKPRSLVFNDKPHMEDIGGGFNVDGLLDILKTMPFTESNGGSNADPVKDANPIKDAGPVKDNCLNANMQKSDKNDRLNGRDFPGGTYWNEEEDEDEEINDLEVKSISSGELRQVENSVSTSKNERKQPKRNEISKNRKDDNKVVVTFLHSNATESFIRNSFQSCGKIMEVELPNVKEHLLKTAYIHFQTREGYEKALKKSGLVIGQILMIVESATSTEKGSTAQIQIPNLIGDPDIPTALVKNPTRTIKIEPLTSEISSHHIEDALSFCMTNVSGYFLGSSSSVAYVEFETELGKERALAKQSINVLGRDMVMLRIDNPRTIAVRISNIESLVLRRVFSLCRELGHVRMITHRSSDIIDVQFSVADWPNMSNILNRLNGFQLEGIRLRAEAAPTFPPDVLLALWQQLAGRKHVKATARALLRKISENGLDISALATLENDLVDKF